MADTDLGWGDLLSMGLTTAAVVAAGLVLGWLADRFTGTSPALLLVGLALGIVGAVAFMITKFRTYLKPDNPEHRVGEH